MRVKERTGPDFKYVPLLRNRKPALNYRDKITR